jgi:hypothetical protein
MELGYGFSDKIRALTVLFGALPQQYIVLTVPNVFFLNIAFSHIYRFCKKSIIKLLLGKNKK